MSIVTEYEQWDKLYMALHDSNPEYPYKLVHMWVKQGVISQSTFIEMIRLVKENETTHGM